MKPLNGIGRLVPSYATEAQGPRERGDEDVSRQELAEEHPDRVQEELQESLLTHPTRQSILETVQAKPGINRNQIGVELDLVVKLLNYHVTKLEDAEVIVRMPSAQGKEALYFAPEDVDLWENPRTRILFGRKPTRYVAMFIADHPGTSSAAIAEALDLTPVTIRHHIRTLKEHNIIVSAKIGYAAEYHPLTELMDWVEDLGDRYERPWES